MEVTQVTGNEAVNAILNRTEKNWKEEGFKVKRNSAVGWEIVSALSDKCMVTLQLMTRNGAFGYLTRSEPSTLNAITPQSLGVSIPGNAKITSSLLSDDDGREGLTMSMTSTWSLEELNKFFALQLNENKWTGISSHEMRSMNAQVINSISVKAQRGRKQIEIVIWPEREAQIVMTISDAI